MNKKNVEHFRAMLQNVLNSTEGSQEAYSKGVYAVVRAITNDFNKMFPVEVWESSSAALHVLAENHCTTNTSLCPVCENKLVERKGKAGSFLGCSTFPACKGSRNTNGRITINEALKTFIASKVYEEQVILESNLGRFNNIDLDDEF